MSSARIAFGFIPFPVAIVDEDARLSLGEYRLLGYLLRHRFRVKSDMVRITQDELLRGVLGPDGKRRDKGSGITSGRDLKMARLKLEKRGWLKVQEQAGGMLYELCLSDGDEEAVTVEPESAPASSAEQRPAVAESAKCTLPAAPQESAKCTLPEAPPESAFCSVSECILSTLPVQNAPEVIRKEKVKKVIEESLVLTASAESGARANKPVDPRHRPCKAVCEEYAKAMKVQFLWNGSEAKALALLLSAAPDMTVEVFTQCVRNRARSDVAHGERPRIWLETLPKYQSGPLDRYGVPKGDGNGTGGKGTTAASGAYRGGADKRTDGNINAALRVYERLAVGAARPC